MAVSTILDGPIVILPMSMQQWYSGQEGAGISFLAMMQSRFQYDYTLPDVSIDYSRQLAKVLFRRTKSAIPTVHDEVLQLALPDNISGYQFWQVYPDMLIAFVRVTNRMLVGEDMCRCTRPCPPYWLTSISPRSRQRLHLELDDLDLFCRPASAFSTVLAKVHSAPCWSASSASFKIYIPSTIGAETAANNNKSDRSIGDYGIFRQSRRRYFRLMVRSRSL